MLHVMGNKVFEKDMKLKQLEGELKTKQDQIDREKAQIDAFKHSVQKTKSSGGG